MLDLGRIKLRRIALELTLREVADRLGYQSVNGFWRLENGLSDISASRLYILSKVLDMPIQDLYKGDK